MWSIMTITLDQLTGTWLTDDGRCTMWIGGENNTGIVINCNGKNVLSEYTRFRYDNERNICLLSNSVVLYQLFDDQSIRVKVTLGEQTEELFLSRGK